MPIDDFTGDKPDAVANAVTTPGKYLKLVVPDFSDTTSNTNPAQMAPTPLTSYLRLGAVEDVTKAGKSAVAGGLGLITDLSGYPLVLGTKAPDGSDQYNAPFNPAYDPYVDFGTTNLPADGQVPLPPATTPTEEIPTAANPSPPPQGAPAYTSASGPDTTGEDLASLIQGFADDTRNRGRLRMTLRGMVDVLGAVVPATPGGNPRDQVATVQGPLYGYPWVKPVTGAKAPGQLDAGNTSPSRDPQYTASSKPVFFPDDYRTLESSQLHTKGGWRDHTDGNRITTTRGDKIEVVRGNYKLIVLGRQDQTKPNKFASVDMSGGFATTEPAGDASTDYSPGSTAYSNLFEWRQCTTPATFSYEAGLYQSWLAAQGINTVSTHDADAAQATLDQALVAAQQLADPRSVLQSTIAAAQQMVLTADSPARQLIAATQLSAAKKALLTAQQAVDPDLLQGYAMAANAALAPPGVTAAYAAAVKQDSTYAANDPTNGVWYSASGTTVGDVTAAINAATDLSTTATSTKTWATAVQAWAAWTSNPPDIYADPGAIANPASAANTAAADTATSTFDATALANAQTASAQASAAATAATNAAVASGADAGLLSTATQAAAKAATDAATAAADEQAAAALPGVSGALLAAAMDAQQALVAAQQALAANPTDPTLATAAANAQTAADNAKSAAEMGLSGTTLAAVDKAIGDANTAASSAATAKSAASAVTKSPNKGDKNLVSAATKAAAAAATAAAAVQTLEAAAAAAAAKAKADAGGAKTPDGTVSTAPLAAAVKAALAAWTGTINGQAVPATNAVMCAARVAQLALNAPPDNLNKTDRAAYEWGKAAAAEAQLQASAMALGTIFTSPLETLQIWEDVDPDPIPFPHYADGDYRTVSTAKKGGGPKIQVKYQAGGRNNDYAQEPVDGDGFVRGATFAKPISMGVSINETWSYQIYNYTGVGYYPATAPQPWPPAPPQGKSQPLGVGVDPTQMAGVALPAKPPDRGAATDPWPSPIPEWVIYPVAKSVTKTHVLQQSTETFVNQTVSLLAGPRSHPSVQDHLRPERTTPSDVMSYVDTSGNAKTSYADQAGAQHPLATQAVYDRNLLTDPNTQFSATQFPSGLVDGATARAWPNNVPPAPPTTPAEVAAATAAAKVQLTAWILGGNPLEVGSYNKIPHTWSETHVSHQATIVRADTTLSDTVVGSQNTMVNANDITTHTTVSGLQHTILHTGATTTETTVDGQQSTTLNAGSTFSQTTASSTSTINNVGAASTITNAFATSAITNTLASFSMQNTAMVALALKGALVDLSIVAALKHIGMNIGICFDITVGPHFTLKLAQMGLKAADLDITAGTKTGLAAFHNLF